MIEKLNIEAFELIDLVTYKPNEIPMERPELSGSIKERGFVDLSDKLVGYGIERTTDHIGNTISIFIHKENGSYGFNEFDFHKFGTLVENLNSLESFNKKASLSFIEAETLKWVINVYNSKKAESSLYDCLMSSIDLQVKPYTFYFPILNLEIETSFKIGNVEFTFFTKEYFDTLYKSLKEKNKTLTEKTFSNIYRKDFQGKVLAKVTVTGERNKAEEIAKDVAEISVDVLKLFSETAIAVAEKKTMFDLNHKLSYQLESNYLTHNQDKEDSLSINSKYNNYPFTFTEKHYNSAKQLGLKTFSDFISKRQDCELNDIIIQSIHLFGFAISNWDLNLRCVNLITILESIFLKDDDEWKMEEKTKKRLANLLSNQQQEKERIKIIFSNIYQVRHKMIHKAKRLNIDFKELSEAQRIIVTAFIRLIQFNLEFGYKDKLALIEKLEETKTDN
ncbi:hypothetical protein Palpr_1889 [Paludibacter propionicigenes WB4]|uniref:Uncharacterized protein n=2 Tax=Paludibacter TaxID=346096 RepID=E4T5N4_PALPW|nr:hypothetical protein Palpr_1889 [Paludibacter propionicigenes WB4]